MAYALYKVWNSDEPYAYETWMHPTVNDSCRYPVKAWGSVKLEESLNYVKECLDNSLYLP